MKKFDRSENIRLTNIKRVAKSEAIVFFLSCIDDLSCVNEVTRYYYLKKTDWQTKAKLFNALNDLYLFENETDVIHVLNSYRADQVLAILGINFNKNKLKVFSRNEGQNKQLTSFVLNTIRDDKEHYQAVLQLCIDVFIKDRLLIDEDS